MKVMKTFLVVLAFAIILAGCGGGKNAEEIPQRYIEAITVLKDDLKDPTSMRIYGDIVAVTFVDTNQTAISVIYDAKNSYGAYSGKSTAEIFLSQTIDPFYVTNDSDYFIDIRSVADDMETMATRLENDNLSDSERENIEFAISKTTIEILSGETVASMLDVEYYAA